MKKFTLQEALFLAFCACFIVITRAVFRLHLNIPGHAMFFTMFFLILGRGCVPKMGAATLVGLLAGLLCTLLGMGKGGPLILMKFLFPALMVDLVGFFPPDWPEAMWRVPLSALWGPQPVSFPSSLWNGLLEWIGILSFNTR
jgi:hypothetical protein